MKLRGGFWFGIRFYWHSLHFNTLHCYCNMLHLHLGSQGTIICVFTLLSDKLSTAVFFQKLSNLNCFYISLHLKQPSFLLCDCCFQAMGDGKRGTGTAGLQKGQLWKGNMEQRFSVIAGYL